MNQQPEEISFLSTNNETASSSPPPLTSSSSSSSSSSNTKIINSKHSSHNNNNNNSLMRNNKSATNVDADDDANNIQIDENDDDDEEEDENKATSGNNKNSSSEAGVLINSNSSSSSFKKKQTQKLGNLSSTSSSSSDIIQRMNDDREEEEEYDEEGEEVELDESSNAKISTNSDKSKKPDQQPKICTNKTNRDSDADLKNQQQQQQQDTEDSLDQSEKISNNTQQQQQQQPQKTRNENSSFKKKLLNKSQEEMSDAMDSTSSSSIINNSSNSASQNENENNVVSSSSTSLSAQNGSRENNSKKLKHHDTSDNTSKKSNGLIDTNKSLNTSSSSTTKSTSTTSSVSSDSASSSSSSAISSGQSSPILISDSSSATVVPSSASTASTTAAVTASNKLSAFSSSTNNSNQLSSSTKEQVKKMVTNNIINNNNGGPQSKPSILNHFQQQQQHQQPLRSEEFNSLISQAFLNQTFFANYSSQQQQFPFHLPQSISAPKLHETKKFTTSGTARLSGLNETMSTTHTYVPPASSNSLSMEVKAKLKNAILQKRERDGNGGNPLAHSLNKSAAHILEHNHHQQGTDNRSNNTNGSRQNAESQPPYQRNDFGAGGIGAYDSQANNNNMLQNQLLLNKSLMEDENSLRRTTSEPNLKVKSALKASLLEKRNQAHPFNNTKRSDRTANNNSSSSSSSSAGFQVPNNLASPSSKLFNAYRAPFTNNNNQFAPKFQPSSTSSFKPISENENFENKLPDLMASPEFRTLLALAQNNPNSNGLKSLQALLQAKLLQQQQQQQQQQQNEQENNSEMAVDSYESSKTSESLAKSLQQQQQSPNATSLAAAAALLGLSQQQNVATDVNNNSSSFEEPAKMFNSGSNSRLPVLNELETSLQTFLAHQQQQSQQANLLATLQQMALQQQQQQQQQQKSHQQTLLEYLASTYTGAVDPSSAAISKLNERAASDFATMAAGHNLLANQNHHHQALMQQYSDLFLYNQSNRNRLNQSECLLNPKIAASMSYPNLPINGLINFNSSSAQLSKASAIPKFGHMAHVEEDNELLLANELKNAAKLNDATQSSMIYESTSSSSQQIESNPLILALQQQQQQQQLNGSRSLLGSDEATSALQSLQQQQQQQQNGFNFLNNSNNTNSSLAQLQQQQQLELIRQELIEQKKRQQFQKSSFFSDPYLLKTLETTSISTPHKTDDTSSFTFPASSTSNNSNNSSSKLADFNLAATAAARSQQSMFATNFLASNKNFLSSLAGGSSTFMPDKKTPASTSTSQIGSSSPSSTFTKNSPSNMSMECSLNQTDDRTYRYTTGIVYDPTMLKHECTCNNSSIHLETPERLKVIWSRLESTGLIDDCELINSKMASISDLILCHNEQYALIFGTEKELRPRLPKEYLQVYIMNVCLASCRGFALTYDPDNSWNEDYTPTACRIAIGSSYELAKLIYNGKLKNGFALVRPPGSHAEISRPLGFCYFNTIAIVAKMLKKNLMLDRILIVDWDVHHGNGTQQMTYNDPNIMYISLHRHDAGSFFPGTGPVSECGEEEALGTNVNIAWNGNLNPPMGDVEYLAAFRSCVMPIAKAFKPQIVLVSCGFDGTESHSKELGGYKITPTCFGYMTRKLMGLADGKCLLVLEGGYNLESLADCSEMCMNALMSKRLPSFSSQTLNSVPNRWAIEDLQNVIDNHKKYWPILNECRQFINISHNRYLEINNNE